MPFPVWLRKTAYERLLKLRRFHVEAARRSVGRELGLPDRSSLLLARPFLDRGSSPSEQVARGDLVRLVRLALAELSETDREVLLMRNVEELPYREIGCILELDPAAARKRYGRALLRLRSVADPLQGAPQPADQVLDFGVGAAERPGRVMTAQCPGDDRQ